jgi:hypothetical protein
MPIFTVEANAVFKTFRPIGLCKLIHCFNIDRRIKRNENDKGNEEQN